MVAKPTPTKDEVWLEKTFGTNLAKLDAKVQEGGKQRHYFLTSLQNFRRMFTHTEDRFADLLKPDHAALQKFRDADQNFPEYLKRAQKLRVTLVAAAKEGDIDRAIEVSVEYDHGLTLAAQLAGLDISR